MRKNDLEYCIGCLILGFLIALLTICNCKVNNVVPYEGYKNCLNNSANIGTNSKRVKQTVYFC